MKAKKLTGMEASAKFRDWYDQGIRFFSTEDTKDKSETPPTSSPAPVSVQ